MLTKQIEQLEFGGFVALPTNAGHHLTAFGFAPYIIHQVCSIAPEVSSEKI
jgi:hypothetical protein